jgi:type II secretory pathway pseudopilin PulG
MRRQKGSSLIELQIVMAIILNIATIALSSQTRSTLTGN